MTNARHRRTMLAALAASALVAGCTADHSGLTSVAVQEAASLHESGVALLVDSNGEATRERYGVIPGAVLLSSSGDYDVAGELPAEKNRKLVFYCASERCSAAPTAARRALEAGYRDVNVLPEGIKGWVDAGLPVEKAATG